MKRDLFYRVRLDDQHSPLLAKTFGLVRSATKHFYAQCLEAFDEELRRRLNQWQGVPTIYADYVVDEELPSFMFWLAKTYPQCYYQGVLRSIIDRVRYMLYRRAVNIWEWVQHGRAEQIGGYDSPHFLDDPYPDDTNYVVLIPPSVNYHRDREGGRLSVATIDPDVDVYTGLLRWVRPTALPSFERVLDLFYDFALYNPTFRVPGFRLYSVDSAWILSLSVTPGLVRYLRESALYTEQLRRNVQHEDTLRQLSLSFLRDRASEAIRRIYEDADRIRDERIGHVSAHRLNRRRSPSNGEDPDYPVVFRPIPAARGTDVDE
jgi:hypothetical protein